jgi:ribonuclease HI
MGSKPFDFYRVAQANLQRCESATITFFNKLIDEKYDIALVQEPYTGNKGIVNKTTFSGKIFQKGNADTPVKAAILILNPDLARGCILLEKYSNNLNIFVEALVDGIPLVVGSLYFPPNDDINSSLEKCSALLNSNKQFKILIGADANSKSIWWGSSKTDRRGDILVDFISQNQLNIVNEGATPTFETVRDGALLASVIDITLCSDNLIRNIDKWKVDRQIASLSDHNGITFNLNSLKLSESVKVESTFLYKTSKANWTKFSKTFNAQLLEKKLSKVDIDSNNEASTLNRQVSAYMDAISEASRSSIPAMKTSTQKKCPWWNSDLEDLKTKTIQAKRKLMNSASARRNFITLPAYLEAKQSYRDAIVAAKTKSWKDFCTRQNKETVWSSVQRILKYKHHRLPETLKFNSETTTSAQESASALLKHFFPDDMSSNDTPEQLCIRNNDDAKRLITNDKPFTTLEIKNILYSLGSGKAPGRDHFTADICQKAFECSPDVLTSIFNACLRIGCFPLLWKIARIKIIPKPAKEDYGDVNAYRPIGLLPVLGKILEKLLVKRISWKFHRLNKLSKQQFGFTQQKSAEDAMLAAVTCIKQATKDGHHVCVISLDIKGAFDNAWWPHLMQQLARLDCPLNIYNVFKDYLSDRMVEIRYAGASSAKSSNKGCIQGSACGPVLWNIVLDELLQIKYHSSVHIQAFADDVLLIIKHKDTNALEQIANETLSIVTNWGDKVKLKFSEEKTNALFITKRKAQVPNLVMRGKHLNFAKDCKILGIVLDENLNWSKHVDYITKKATKIANKLVFMAKPTWGLSPEIIRTIYTGVVEPTITYAAAVWSEAAKRKNIQNKLNRVQRAMGIRMCKAYRTVSLTSVQAMAHLMPLDLRIKELGLINNTKNNHTICNLPDDIQYQGRVAYTELPHPSEQVGEATGYPDTYARRDFPDGEIDIYTDGSKTGGKVGAAFTVFNNAGELHSKKLPMADYCSVFQAELFAIMKALDWVSSKTSDWKKVNLLSDSKSSVQALEDGAPNNPMVFSIQTASRKLKSRGIDCEFLWVRGHNGLLGNERADELAKDAALHVKTAKMYTKFPLSYAKREIRLKSLSEWEILYQNSQTGSGTKLFFQNLQDCKNFGKLYSPTFETTQIFTGHGATMSYLHRFKLKDSFACPCDQQTEQNVIHVLLHCPMFAVERYRFEKECQKNNVPMEDFQKVLLDSRVSKAFLAFTKYIIDKLTPMNK